MNPAETTLYGDLHFHTHYSDNRDRASVEAMIERGLECGIQIFGTGDHNHNMTAESFRAQMAETDEVRARHPGLVILNNSEMTFLIGHFHVFDPGPITGSIEEAYAYLYDRHDRLTMANHPGLPTDEWDRRIIPTISAIEIVNGSVLNEAFRQGTRLHSIFDVPAVGTYVRYLRLGIPVAVLGNSDGHSLGELGTGFTGFHIEGIPDKEKVLESIRGRTTFATTTPGIDLRWQLQGDRIAWSVQLGAEGGVHPADAAVEVYNGDRLVERSRMGSSRESGFSILDTPGLYWLSVLSERDFAVSSPVGFELDRFEVGEEDRRHAEDARILAAREGSSVAVTGADVRAERDIDLTEPVRIAVYSALESPVVTDSAGERKEARISARRDARPIIVKECEPWRFGEFYVWLERNQVHEYRFTAVEYRLEGPTFFFSANLLPYRLDKRPNADDLYRDRLPAIKALVERSERCRISVLVPPSLELQLEAGRLRLPLSISDSVPGVSSRITLLPSTTGEVELEQFFLETRG